MNHIQGWVPQSNQVESHLSKQGALRGRWQQKRPVNVRLSPGCSQQEMKRAMTHAADEVMRWKEKNRQQRLLLEQYERMLKERAHASCESSHPSLPTCTLVWKMHVKDAAQLRVHFDPQTCTPPDGIVSIYMPDGTRLAQCAGQEGWPGVGDTPSLLIEGEKFNVTFENFSESERDTAVWGFRLLAKAIRFKHEPETEEQKALRIKQEAEAAELARLEAEAAEQARLEAEAETATKRFVDLQLENNVLLQKNADLERRNTALRAENEELEKALGSAQEDADELRGEIQDINKIRQAEKKKQLKGKFKLLSNTATRIEQGNKERQAAEQELQKTRAEKDAAAKQFEKSRKESKSREIGNTFVTKVRARVAVSTAEKAVEEVEKEVKRERAMRTRAMEHDTESSQVDIVKLVAEKAMGMEHADVESLSFEISSTLQSMERLNADIIFMVQKTTEKTCGRSYDITPVSKEVTNAVERSKEVYCRAITKIKAIEEEEADALRELGPETAGVRTNLWDWGDEGDGTAPSRPLLQSSACNTCDGLLGEAREAQEKLKATISQSGPRSGALSDAHSWKTPSELKSRRHSLEGGADWFSVLVDPGVKKAPRCKQKVEIKYAELGFPRVLDACRAAVVCDTCARMQKAVQKLSSMFEVLSIDNRHSNPTALGWADIQLQVRVELGGGRSHIAEIQVQHQLLFNARNEVHADYRLLREALPKHCDVEHEHTELVVEAALAAYDAQFEKLQRRIHVKWAQKRQKKLNAKNRRTSLKRKPKRNISDSRLLQQTAASKSHRVDGLQTPESTPKPTNRKAVGRRSPSDASTAGGRRKSITRSQSAHSEWEIQVKALAKRIPGQKSQKALPTPVPGRLQSLLS